jgi:hypothetical protein
LFISQLKQPNPANLFVFVSLRVATGGREHGRCSWTRRIGGRCPGRAAARAQEPWGAAPHLHVPDASAGPERRSQPPLTARAPDEVAASHAGWSAAGDLSVPRTTR